MEVFHHTRNKTFYAGKPRVLFLSNPEDHNTFFNKYCRDLLDIEDCDVLEPDSNAVYASSEVRALIDGCSVVVVPITRRFLNSESRAYSVGLPTALECGANVIPILEEPNLEGAFEESFGAIQLLSRFTENEAITFKDRFAAQVRDAMGSPAERAREREAFGPRVFLSYRRAARARVHKVMGRIHNHPLFWNASIWYDDFLVAGKGYDEGIKRSLQSCDLFLLFVTPSLLLEDNYVLREELPLAINYGKEILAVSFEKSLCEAMAALFPGLGPCVYLDDAGQLEKALTGIGQTLGLSEKRTARSEFLIGLAHMRGIDVEPDEARAYTLIKTASDDGYAPATRELARMRMIGKCTEKKPEVAIVMALKAAHQYQDDLLRHSDYDKMIEYIAFLRSWANLAFAMRERGAVKQFAQHLEYLCRASGQNSTFAALRTAASSCSSICHSRLYMCSGMKAEAWDSAAASFRHAQEALEMGLIIADSANQKADGNCAHAVLIACVLAYFDALEVLADTSLEYGFADANVLAIRKYDATLKEYQGMLRDSDAAKVQMTYWRIMAEFSEAHGMPGQARDCLLRYVGTSGQDSWGIDVPFSSVLRVKALTELGRLETSLGMLDEAVTHLRTAKRIGLVWFEEIGGIDGGYQAITQDAGLLLTPHVGYQGYRLQLFYTMLCLGEALSARIEAFMGVGELTPYRCTWELFRDVQECETCIDDSFVLSRDLYNYERLEETEAARDLFVRTQPTLDMRCSKFIRSAVTILQHLDCALDIIVPCMRSENVPDGIMLVPQGFFEHVNSAEMIRRYGELARLRAGQTVLVTYDWRQDAFTAGMVCVKLLEHQDVGARHVLVSPWTWKYLSLDLKEGHDLVSLHYPIPEELQQALRRNMMTPMVDSA